ncbi:MAG: hypothetical protein KAH48_00525 [Chlorobi bacterium]|nr:hypothetical protein [Chlorobiota bacterium]
MICILFFLNLLSVTGAGLYGKELSKDSSMYNNFGMGISINPLSAYHAREDMILFSENILNLHLVLKHSKDSRFEFTFGTYKQRRYVSNADNYESQTSVSLMKLAAGWQATWHPEKNTQLYLGPRVGMLRSSKELTYKVASAPVFETIKESKFSYTMGVSAGAEYFVAKNFSLGLEIQCNYFSNMEHYIDE